MANLAIPSSLPYPALGENIIAEKLSLMNVDDVTSMYGDQSQFSKWKCDCIENTHSQFLISQKTRQFDFLSTLNTLGQQRKKIAEQMNTPNHQKFGLLRTVHLPNEATTLTHLTAPRYREFNQKLRVQFSDFFPLFQENVDHVSAETSFSRFTVEKIDHAKLNEMISKISKPMGSKAEALQANVLIGLLNSIGGLSDLIHSFDFPGIQRPKSKDVGGILTIGSLQFLVGTIETKIKGEWKTLTHHIAWLKQKESGPILDRTIEYFKNFGFVTLVHSPKDSIPFHIDALEPLTKKLITSKYENPKEFKRDLAVWEFRFSHAMPYYRGTVTILEIFKEAICRLHNQNLPNLTDADRLSVPFLETFLKSY